MISKLNVVYAYSWHLASSDIANVQQIMEAVRVFCIEHGCEDISSMDVQGDSVLFTAVVPKADQHEFGLRFSTEDGSWSTSSWLRVSSLREISRIMFYAATQGVTVRTMFAGMELCYRKNEIGVIDVVQRSAFDLEA